MKQIDPISLKEKIDNEEDFQLVDIRDAVSYTHLTLPTKA